MKTFAATARRTLPARRGPVPAPGSSSAPVRAEIRQILHTPRLQQPGMANDNVIQRFKLSKDFCLLGNENRRIKAAHQEALVRTARIQKILSGSMTANQKDFLKQFFGKEATSPGNIAKIRGHYSNIQAALNREFTYYCVDAQTAPEVCNNNDKHATNAQTMGVCGAGNVLRDDGLLDKAVTTDDGDVALCMDKMRKFSLKGLTNILIHENLHRSGVCGHSAYCTDQADGECASPPVAGHCSSLGNASFVEKNPDSYGCFALLP